MRGVWGLLYLLTALLGSLGQVENHDLRELLKHHEGRDPGKAVTPTSATSSKFIAINGQSPSWLEEMQCREMRQPLFSLSRSLTTRSTCCLLDAHRPKGDHTSRVKCLPSFIIGGTQKSGTTVLSAYLATHPAIAFPSRKEVHYFSDGRKRRNLKIGDYFKAFELWNYTSTASEYGNSRQPRINGEATPYYLASRESCAKIAATLPHVKFIVLMREPVARAWSEYQMKKRRVETQNAFIDLCSKHAVAMRACLLSAAAKNPGSERWAHVLACSPPELTAHVGWSKLKAMISSRALNASMTWEEGVGMCFVARKEEEGMGAVDRRRLNIKGSSRNGSIESSLLARGFASGSGAEDGVEERGGYRDFRRPVAIRRSPENSSLRRRRRRLRGEDGMLAIPASKGGGAEVEFTAQRCLEKHAREHLVSPEQAFDTELRDFKTCAGALLLDGTLGSLDKAVAQCIKVRVGIANNYAYRSLYAAQLFHCFKSIPRESFLLMPSELLQRDPQRAMERVLRFLGMPMVEEVRGMVRQQLAQGQAGAEGGGGGSGASAAARLNASFISQAVRAYFPKFEASTGWSPAGVQSYEAMNSTLREGLASFLRPYNQMLFALLGEDWSSEWGP